MNNLFTDAFRKWWNKQSPKKKLIWSAVAIVVVLACLWLLPGSPDADPSADGEIDLSAQQSYSDTSQDVADGGDRTEQDDTADESDAETQQLDEHGTYTTAQDVALYIHIYGRLPDNFITKSEASELGWEGGSLEPYAPGYCIGGDRFGNYEGILPEADGRTWTECDINTLAAQSRGAERIVFSNDGLIFYTPDHYESFTQLYP